MMREGPVRESTKIDPSVKGALVGTIQGGSIGLLFLYGAMSQHDSIPSWQRLLCLVVGLYTNTRTAKYTAAK